MSSTLFSIDQDLARLYEEREEEMALVIFDEPMEEERRSQVRAIDLAISERLRDLDRKVDGIAYLCKELTARATAHKAEGKRLTDLAKHEDATAAEIKSRAAEVLSGRIEPEVIAAASQGSNLLKLTGQHNTLSLRKSPPTVMVDDESLLPEDLRTMTVKCTRRDWDRLWELADDAADLFEFYGQFSHTEAPMLSEIAARLRERVLCEFCGGEGSVDIQATEPCPQCHGEKTVPATVPGAHLANYNTYVVVK